jgi:hypothetical protein
MHPNMNLLEKMCVNYAMKYSTASNESMFMKDE